MASTRSLTVAIAGVGGIGGHIFDHLVNEKKHHVVVLSRKERPELTQKGADVRPVDYENVDSLKEALKDVHTVISAIWAPGSAAPTNLIVASEAAGVKRFIPMFACKEGPRELLEKSNLEHTIICNGMFMDYLLPKGAKKHLRDAGLPVSVPDRSADIPGTGEELVTLTAGDDIGHAIGELIHAPDGAWDKYTYVEGETTTWNKVLHAAEAVTGTKFAVVYRSIDQLNKEKEAAAGDFMKTFLVDMALVYARGGVALPKRSKLVDTFHYTTVEEMLHKTYGKQHAFRSGGKAVRDSYTDIGNCLPSFAATAPFLK